MTSPRRRVPAAPALAVAAAVALLAALFVAAPSRAAAGDITTVAGGADLVERPATETLQSGFGLAFRNGTLYIADPYFHVVRALDTATGMERVVAGTGAEGATGDGGAATAARLVGPSGVAVDDDGRLLIADTGNNKVRRVDTGGVITTLAGTGEAGYGGDCDQATTTCPATAARLNQPLGVVADSAGNVYVADTINNRVRRVSPGGDIRNLAGNGTSGSTGDGGPAALASLARPVGLAVDAAGNLFIADSGNDRVRRVDDTGIITTVAGGGVGGLGDEGPATSAQLNGPMAVAVDGHGRLLIADTDHHRVRRVDGGGTITTVAGGDRAGFAGDGGPATAAGAHISGPKGVVAGAGGDTGQFFFADTGNYRVRKVDGSAVITTIAGSGLLGPAGLVAPPDGGLLVADATSNMVRRVGPDGRLTRLAGTGVAGFSGDCAPGGGACPATSAQLKEPTAVDADGDTLYIADSGNDRVRRIDSAGNIATVLGTGSLVRTSCVNASPSVASVDLMRPTGVAADRSGNLFVADTGHDRVCKLSPDGRVSRFAGGGSPDDGLGDGGPAVDAALADPKGLTVDAAGNLLITDSGHGRVRRVDAVTLTITTVAGGGAPAGGVGDSGPAASASLAGPSAVALDGAGNLFIAESTGHRVRRVEAGSGTITTVAGDGTSGFAGDGGPAGASRLANPAGVVVDGTGNVMVADFLNHRARRVEGVGVPVTPAVGPGIASMVPDRGPTYGGTEVTITGRGFTGATAVRFGSGTTVPFRLRSDTELIAVSPAHAVGTVDVTITTPLGTSTRSAAARFAFEQGSWTATGRLGVGPSQVDGVPRTDHTATRLVDGRVLVAGGTGNEPASAEAYDPVTQQWSGVGAMATGRRNHTATLLNPPACHGSSPPAGYPCGQVLVVGGRPDTATAELFDPATGRWSAAASMSMTRWGHSATLLDDGRVLVAGGYASAVPVPSGLPIVSSAPVVAISPSVEIFEPALSPPGTTVRGTWRGAVPMLAARQGHTATVLKSGKVVVAGAADATDPTAPSAEVFDPDSGAWLATGSMVTLGRKHHTATRVAGGRVLVAGGSDRAAELYDPATDTWTATAPSLSAHAQHTATLLAEPGCSPLCGRVLLAGSDVERFEAAELFDPATGEWAPAPALLEGRHAHTATPLADGTVLVAGGRIDGEHILASAELFHPSTVPLALTVEAITPPAGPTTGGTEVAIRGAGFFPGPATVSFGDVAVPVTLAAGTVLFVTSPPHPQGNIDVRVTTPEGTVTTPFTFGAGSWAPTGALDGCAHSDASCTPRQLHTATLLDGAACRTTTPPDWCGQVLVAGGLRHDATGGSGPIASAELYDPSAGAWRATGRMVAPHADHTATLLGDGRVLVVGGTSAELYDPAGGTWSSTSPPADTRTAHTATLLPSGKVLVAGSSANATGTADATRDEGVVVRRSAELYDPVTGAWSSTTSMGAARYLHTATLLANGRVLVAGGLGHTGTPSCEDAGPGDHGCDELPLASTEIYDPSTGRWSGAADLAVPRFAHSSALLGGPACGTRCGTVLVAGGVGGSPEYDPAAIASTEIFDRASGEWRAAPPLHDARGGHTATVLPDGGVLVAGGGGALRGEPEPIATAEVFRPQSGTWSRTGSMRQQRGVHSATLLDGPACRDRGAGVGAPMPGYCGQVLAAGGAGRTGNGPSVEVAGAELYAPAPAVTRLDPARGPSSGGTEVVIEGTDLSGTTAVSFGGLPAVSFRVDSPSRIVAVTPPRHAGPVEVAVTSARGTSGHAPADLSVPFTYAASGAPGRVTGLSGVALSDTSVRLDFPAVHADGAFPEGSPPATDYVVRQSSAPITDPADFAAATPLCGGTCRLQPAAVGQNLSLDVVDLAPATTYHYAVQVRNDYASGPISDNIAVTTLERAPRCAAVALAGPNSVTYPTGYSLVGLPGGTRVPARSPLYGWFDQGAGGRYSADDAGAVTTTAGRGYWAWFACPVVVDLPAAGDPTSGTGATRFSLGAYHASMVGNPSAAAPATVSGHDYAARWDPAINGGAGGYVLSGYREPQSLAVGAGGWIFAYDQTDIVVSPEG